MSTLSQDVRPQGGGRNEETSSSSGTGVVVMTPQGHYKEMGLSHKMLPSHKEAMRGKDSRLNLSLGSSTLAFGFTFSCSRRPLKYRAVIHEGGTRSTGLPHGEELPMGMLAGGVVRGTVLHSPGRGALVSISMLQSLEKLESPRVRRFIAENFLPAGVAVVLSWKRPVNTASKSGAGAAGRLRLTREEALCPASLGRDVPGSCRSSYSRPGNPTRLSFVPTVTSSASPQPPFSSARCTPVSPLHPPAQTAGALSTVYSSLRLVCVLGRAAGGRCWEGERERGSRWDLQTPGTVQGSPASLESSRSARRAMARLYRLSASERTGLSSHVLVMRTRKMASSLINNIFSGSPARPDITGRGSVVVVVVEGGGPGSICKQGPGSGLEMEMEEEATGSYGRGPQRGKKLFLKSGRQEFHNPSLPD
ncbi:hypothetical protein INR49_000440 [Caranx melampygus]|nr:hypothetical protein INR49_000440 [Caranx melampygus]